MQKKMQKNRKKFFSYPLHMMVKIKPQEKYEICIYVKVVILTFDFNCGLTML